MSNYCGRAVHPTTGETEDAVFIDNRFEPRKYGVEFRGRSIWPATQVREVGQPMEGPLWPASPKP